MWCESDVENCLSGVTAEMFWWCKLSSTIGSGIHAFVLWFPLKAHWVFSLTPRPHENTQHVQCILINCIYPPHPKVISIIQDIGWSSGSSCHPNVKPFSLTGINEIVQHCGDVTAAHRNPLIRVTGAWVQRELSDKRVHVYSNFTFIERMVLDNYITVCIYLFTIFYLKLTYITACLLKQMKSEQKGECESDLSNIFLCIKKSITHICFLWFSFLL